MKNNSFRAWSLSGLLIAFAGCTSGTAGGPGAADDTRQLQVGQPDDSFRLNTVETALRQGETKSISITIDRALNFDQDVALSFAELPQGLTIDDMSPVILHGASEARLVLAATADASLGDFSIKVIGHPVTGSDAVKHLKITITKG